MNVLAKPRMSVDEFLTWAEGRPGRYELFRGEVFAMSPEGLGHIKVKYDIHLALRTAIRQRKLRCHAVGDGATVRIDQETAYEPDALVYCGEPLPPSDRVVPEPVIIIEVLSPSSPRIDMAQKLAGYFRLPSVAHYLIVDPTQPTVIHHARGTGDTIATRVVTEGSIALDPPGIALSLADIYAAD